MEEPKIPWALEMVDDAIETYADEHWTQDCQHPAREHWKARAALAEMIEAVSARYALSARIRNAGPQPHPDSWAQSIAEADARVRAAIYRVEGGR